MKDILNRLTSSAVICLLLAATGCAKYQATSLVPLHAEFTPYAQTQSDVAIAAKALNKSECKRYLGRDVIKKGYQPVQITIDNRSKKHWVFSRQGVSLPCAPADEVAKLVHTSTAGRATAYGVGGLIFWPLLIPAVLDGCGSAAANDQLDADFDAKAARDEILQPYAQVNTILFVPRSAYREDFTITLIDRETQEPVRFELRAARS